MILVFHNVFGFFVRHPSWLVCEGRDKGMETPYMYLMYYIVALYPLSISLTGPPSVCMSWRLYVQEIQA